MANRRIAVSEEDERIVKRIVQDIFFGAMDELRQATGTVDREASVAFCAQGLGQALKAARTVDGTVEQLPAEAPRWEQALFAHLKLVKVNLSADPKRISATSGTFEFVPPLVEAFRTREEWFFTSSLDYRLKAWLVACYRVIQRVVPTVRAERAAALFLEHFRDGVLRPAVVSRPRAVKVKPAKPKRRAKPAPRAAKKGRKR